MTDFNKLIDEGWSFGVLDVEDYYALRHKLRKVEELPSCYSIALDEIGTPAFTRERHPGPACYFSSKGVHQEHGEIFIFVNPNDEGYVLANVPIANLLGINGNR